MLNQVADDEASGMVGSRVDSRASGGGTFSLAPRRDPVDSMRFLVLAGAAGGGFVGWRIAKKTTGNRLTGMGLGVLAGLLLGAFVAVKTVRPRAQ